MQLETNHLAFIPNNPTPPFLITTFINITFI